MPDNPETTAATERPSTMGRARISRLQFSLRAVFVLALFVSLIVLGYLWPYHRQRTAANRLEKLGGQVVREPAGPEWLRAGLGAQIMQDILRLNVADLNDPNAYMNDVLACPRLKVLTVGGAAFDDDQLQKLGALERLEVLVLDCTEVTKPGIASLKEKLPELSVVFSPDRVLKDWANRGVVRQTQQRPGMLLRGNPPPGARIVRVGSLISLAKARFVGGVDFLSFTDKVRDSDLKKLRWFSELQMVEFEGGQVTDEGLRTLAAVAKVRHLKLRGNHSITTKGLAHLAKLKLTALELEAFDFGGDSLPFLKGLTELRNLSIVNSGVEDWQLGAVEGLSELRHINLRGNPISDLAMHSVSMLKKMTHVNISETNVTFRALPILETLEQLTQIDAYGSSITHDTARTMQRRTNIRVNY